MSNTLKICKVLAPPTDPDPNTLYIILDEGSNEVRLMISDSIGNAVYNVVSTQKLDPLLYYMLNQGSQTTTTTVTSAPAPQVMNPVSYYMLSANHKTL